ncbi:MAG: YlbF family regulator [Chloroflexi bacterium]|nr:MAG: YlbF family regulator [Chloroflexota bacterium]
MMLTQELEAAAQRMGVLLRETEPLRAYREAERRLEADPEAQALLDHFQALQDDLRTRQTQGQALSEKEIEELYQLQAEVGSHPTLRALFDAGAEVQQYLQAINQDLSQYLGVDFAQLSYRP